jgi:cytochrome c oxidase subunit 4
MNHAAGHAPASPRTYLGVLLALLVLTVITVTVSRYDFGNWNTIIALVIASIKATLVALFFMHLLRDRFNALIFSVGAFFLSVFLIFTLFDVDYRTPVLPGNLKSAPKEFPGAPLNKPIQPSTGAAIPDQPAR